MKSEGILMQNSVYVHCVESLCSFFYRAHRHVAEDSSVQVLTLLIYFFPERMVKHVVSQAHDRDD